MSTDSVIAILQKIKSLQNDTSSHFPEGIFPSYRYHRIVPYKRPDDNVYFTSAILIVLNEIFTHLDRDEKSIASEIISAGEEGLKNYESRLGDPVYNFYRSDGYFPNGKILSKFKTFQPTDDADDTAIAYRGKKHDQHLAEEAKKILVSKSNGADNIWNKRSLKKYQSLPAYNTWIGSKSLYVDIDICVISNVLCFINEYDFSVGDIDSSSLALLEDAILSGDYLTKKKIIAAWYPFDPVIFFQLSELSKKKSIAFSTEVRTQLIRDIKNQQGAGDIMSQILVSLALFNLGEPALEISSLSSSISIDEFLNETARFSYGVIPLLHPFRGRIFQNLSATKMFHLVYNCEAHRLALLLQYLCIKKPSLANRQLRVL